MGSSQSKGKYQQIVPDINHDMSKMPSLQEMAVQRNKWAKKRTIMANKRTLLAYVRTLFLLAAIAKEYAKPQWASYGIVFSVFILLEFAYNTAAITGGSMLFANWSTLIEIAFDLYPVGIVVILTIVLGYLI